MGNIPFRERISSTVEDACAAIGIGRTKLYELIASGQIRSSRVGGKRLIVVSSMLSLIDQAEAAAVSMRHAIKADGRGEANVQD